MSEPTNLDGDSLTKERLNSFRVAKVLKHDKPFTCLDFDTSGELLLTTSEDELRMYDCKAGTHKKTSYSKKYGCGISKFTHRPNNILYSSTKEDNAIRYLSFHDNKFLKYFTGHESLVTAIEMCPQDDTFISASRDGEVRLWDLKSNNCHGILKTNSQNPRIAFDPAGIIFAVTTNSSAIRLYDLKSLSAGPFVTFKIPTELGGSTTMSSEWTTIKFSNCGKWLLVGNKQGSSCAIEAFDGKLLWNFADRTCGHYRGPLDMDIGITPDGKYVYGGSDDGSVQFWEPPPVDDATVSALKSHRSIFPCTQLKTLKDPSPLIKFNPRYMMFASAIENQLVWYHSCHHFPISPPSVHPFLSHQTDPRSPRFSTVSFMRGCIK
ncbi:WD40 repeat-like protein [Rhizoclosmatium globosum]|uniref:WD40 repeat-like protein n=1 Tax=Rhizoclosmatium globosum TaxID=329046 RepID=A0A1Y2CSS1_9FUNG|nr:WD40 repeat-like protein [Rhizoclosmatium globosum]|eukprot:ORY50088.1 WD40 repeat-like protein [Rhizoclosmatium globosum]